MIEQNSEQSKSIALDCALGAQEVQGYGEDNDGWYVSCNDKQIAWAASENYAKRIAERMNARIMMTLAEANKGDKHGKEIDRQNGRPLSLLGTSKGFCA